MSSARLVVEENEKERLVKEDRLDEFARLCTNGEGPRATVGFNVGTQVDFGRVKVLVNITLQCDQSQVMIDRAGELAFVKAVEFMTEGLKLLAPEEPKPETKP